ncbi:MAG TPA: universal stress protein [Oculatellaceae cyanobacterium]|nr:universal stress protein [Syntrophorhabdaceae bacterium]
MFKKILFATDFSNASKKALNYIKQLRGAGAQEVVILHVIDDKELLGLSRAANQYLEIRAQIEDEALKELAAMESDITSEGFSVEIKLKTGQPFTEIMKTAAEDNVSLISIGSHGRSNIEEMLLGSVSENVIRHAKVPVLLISREV